MQLCFELQLIYHFKDLPNGRELMRTWAYLRTKSFNGGGYIKVSHNQAAKDLGISPATFFRHRKLLVQYNFLDKPGKHYHVIGIPHLRKRLNIRSRTTVTLPASTIQNKEVFHARAIFAFAAQQCQNRNQRIATITNKLEPKLGHLKKYIEQLREDRKTGVFSKGQFAYSLFRKHLGIGNSTISKAVKVAVRERFIQAEENLIPLTRCLPEHINTLRAAHPDKGFKVEYFEAFGATLSRVVEIGPTNYTFMLEGFGRRSYG